MSVADGKGGVELDWSNYDIDDKYFVIYRKEEMQENFDIIVSLEEKFSGENFVDNFGNDKKSPSKPNINITDSEENNNVQISVDSRDNGTKYTYYIEAYDNNSLLVAVSNKIRI